MKVILKENVNNVGFVGDVVEVSRGYGRNYLLARGLAVEHTAGNMKSIEHLKQKEWEKRNREKIEAKNLAEKINQITLLFEMKSGKDGKLFGSVTNKEIAEMLVEQHQIEIDRKKIDNPEPLKKVGNYHLPLNLHKEVTAKINVKIVSEVTEKETDQT